MALINLSYRGLGGGLIFYVGRGRVFGGARAAQWPKGGGLRRVVRGRQADSGR